MQAVGDRLCFFLYPTKPFVYFFMNGRCPLFLLKFEQKYCIQCLKICGLDFFSIIYENKKGDK